MKILYSIQATGNGHLSRAREIIPALKLFGDVDILVSGIQGDLHLPFPIKYRFYGLSFIFGKNGGVNILKTILKFKPVRLYSEIRSLPVTKYDVVISDFEPVSAWACRLGGKECISLSHQAAILDRNAPKPGTMSLIGKFLVKNYAPGTNVFGFHFKPYQRNIFSPVIRTEIRIAKVQNLGHFTVYLPSYSDQSIIKILSEIPGVRWEVFSKHSPIEYSTGNIWIYPVQNDRFIESMAGSEGVLCGAGFETPAEALFLKKKLMVIPMWNQFEQLCNAAALKQMKVPVLKRLAKKDLAEIKKWIASDFNVNVSFPDQTIEIISAVLVSNPAFRLNRQTISDYSVSSSRIDRIAQPVAN
jgi:uncharacterized protein (TIGR00661 family)